MLNESAVADVERLLGERLPYRAIAQRTGVSCGSIHAIATGKRRVGKARIPDPVMSFVTSADVLDFPDHFDDVAAALRAVVTVFRAGARQGEAHGTEGVADVRERIRILESRLRDVLQETVGDVWTELVDEAQTFCRRAGVYG